MLAATPSSRSLTWTVPTGVPSPTLSEMSKPYVAAENTGGLSLTSVIVTATTDEADRGGLPPSVAIT